jgi:hypothetical protein
MVQRSAPQQVVAERYFPVRVRVAVPPGGFGSQVNIMCAWLDQHAGKAGYLRARGVVRLAKEIRAVAKLDPFFERTSKLASRRLKREMERRGTLGEFALEPDASTNLTTLL